MGLLCSVKYPASFSSPRAVLTCRERGPKSLLVLSRAGSWVAVDVRRPALPSSRGKLGRAEKRPRSELLRRPLPKSGDSLQSQPSRRPRKRPVFPTPHRLTGKRLATEAKLQSSLKFFFGASLTQLPSKVRRDRRGGKECSQSRSSARRKP